jgi:hypothetical protein
MRTFPRGFGVWVSFLSMSSMESLAKLPLNCMILSDGFEILAVCQLIRHVIQLHSLPRVRDHQ